MAKKVDDKAKIIGRLLSKMDYEGGLTGFIHWGGLEDEMTKAAEKVDPRFVASMRAVKATVDVFESCAEGYEPVEEED